MSIAFKLMLNLSTGNISKEVADLFDGIANLRAETFFITTTGSAIGKCLGSLKEAEAEKAISKRLAEICEILYPKPVWYRTTDSDADLARRLQRQGKPQGVRHGRHRGLTLALSLPELLTFELRLVLNLCTKGVSNLGIKFPMVEQPSQLQHVQETIDQMNIGRDAGLGIGITIETETAAKQSKDFVRHGLRFATVGINDLWASMPRREPMDRENIPRDDEPRFSNRKFLGLLKIASRPLLESGIDCILSGLGKPSDAALRFGFRFFSGVAVDVTDADEVTQIRERLKRLENE